MTMYAITATSYRSISSPQDAAPEETVVDVLPAALLAGIADRESAELATHDTLRSRAGEALDGLRLYCDLPTPTLSQTVAVVKLLCRVAICLVRLQLRRLDGVN
jgi:hypothetical protein